jgi:hypothetical protein
MFRKAGIAAVFMLQFVTSLFGQTTRYVPDLSGDGGTFYGPNGTTRYIPDLSGGGGTFYGPN